MNQKTEVVIDVLKAAYLGIYIWLFSIIFFSVIFLIIWNFDLYWTGIKSFIFELHISVPAFFIGVLTHELIHFLTLLIFAKLKFRDIKFGFKSSIGAPYVQCNKIISAFVYKSSLLAPLIILGIIPSIISVFLQNSWLLIFGTIFISAASGDIAVYLKIRKLPNTTKILDHDSEPGYYIIE